MGGRAFLIGAVAGLLTACGPSVDPSDPQNGPAVDGVDQTPAQSELPNPVARPDPEPDAPTPESVPQPAAAPSQASLNLAQRYATLATRQQSRGLLRRETNPADAPITPYLLARNFEAIALATEHGLAAGGTATSGTQMPLARWTRPITVELITGASVSASTGQAARGDVASTVAQLARASGHPVSMVGSGGNFKVLFLSEDDRRGLGLDGLSALLPGVPFSVQQAILRADPNARCLVVGLGAFGQPHSFSAAVALIRAELPAVMRFACIQEELAQGMGLPNDSAEARPSIFNDNDEFAVLTRHDEWLLRILYDNRLQPGMTQTEAQPIIRAIANELVDGPTALASLQ